MGKRITLYWSGFSFLFTMFLFSPVEGKERVVWMKWELPVMYIVKGPYANQGFSDVMESAFKEKVSEYEHDQLIVNFNRRMKLFERAENDGKILCAFGSIPQPEQVQNTVYTALHSVHPFPGNHILTTKEKEKLFKKEEDRPSFEAILQNQSLILGITAHNIYGVLAPIIEKYKDQKNIFTLNTLTMTDSLVDMTLKGRIDYTLVGPGHVKYRENEYGNSFVLIPVKEINPIMWYQLITCEDTEEGRRAVKVFDGYVQEAKASPEWRDLILKVNLRWGLIREEQIPLWKKHYETIFLKKGRYDGKSPIELVPLVQ